MTLDEPADRGPDLVGREPNADGGLDRSSSSSSAAPRAIAASTQGDLDARGGPEGAADMSGACLTLGHRVPLRMAGRSGPANGRESTADENVPVPPFVESSCFTSCRRQAPT
jgi:hypothetical protein